MNGKPKKKKYKGKSISGKVREPISVVKIKQPKSLDETINALEKAQRKRLKIPEITVWGKRKKKEPSARPSYEP